MADNRAPQRSVPLSEVESSISSDVLEQIALGEHDMRKEMAARIQDIFWYSNIFVVGAVAAAWIADLILLWSGLEKPVDRVVDQGVIKTLIGATTVQVGIIMATIAAYLFPKRQSRGFLDRLRGRE
jgi:hypothetical protein